MSRVMKINQDAPVSVKDALDHGDLTINKNFKEYAHFPN